MSLADELNWRPATELARLIRRRALSPVELLRAHLETIERLNPKINAICTLAAEPAMAAARRAEQVVMSGDEVGLLKTTSYIDWIAPTFLVTLASLPAASAPCGHTAAGLPIGIQIVGPRFAEPKILAVAKFVHEMNPTAW